MSTPNPLGYSDFTARVLALYAAPLRAHATLTTMHHVLDLLGRQELLTTADLTTTTIAAYIVRRSSEVCINTIDGELGYLAAACAIAVEEGWLARNPFDSRRLRVRTEEPTLPQHHPLANLVKVLGWLRGRAERDGWPHDRLYVAASVAAYTGLRRDEVLRLRVEDVDLSVGILCVVAKRQTRGQLKTPESAAPVPIPPALGEVLARWLPLCQSEWLVPNRSRTGPWTGGNPGTKPLDRLKQAGQAVGVPGLTWLSLRHSWATHAEVWGLGEAEIQRVLRHTRPLTQRRYRHADLANLRAIGARVRIAV
jgi:integrase